jgi:hypothetical protein
MLAFMKMLDAGGTTSYPAETNRACRIETARDIKNGFALVMEPGMHTVLCNNGLSTNGWLWERACGLAVPK